MPIVHDRKAIRINLPVSPHFSENYFFDWLWKDGRSIDNPFHVYILSDRSGLAPARHFVTIENHRRECAYQSGYISDRGAAATCARIWLSALASARREQVYANWPLSRDHAKRDGGGECEVFRAGD